MNSKKIAIIRDGYSDFMVLKSFLSSVILNEQNIKLSDKNFLDSELNIDDAINKYLDSNKENKEARIKNLKNKILGALYAASTKESLTNKDIIILNSDAEQRLMQLKNFYKDGNRELYSVIHLAIDEFYEQMVNQGYGFKDLPIIIPLILFPSIEILVAACYLSGVDREKMRTLRAKPDLKIKVWGIENIPVAIETGKIDEVLEFCFDKDNTSSLNEIYKYIPEARNLIHILSYPSFSTSH
ncbi:MAG: hypothetical protein QM487_06675 [Candidatus Marithrix sp.]